MRVGAAEEFGDGDEAEAFTAGGFEDAWEGLKAARRIGDAVVENDDRAGDEIFFDEPADVRDRGTHGIVRIGTAEDATIAALASETDLAWPGESAGRAEERRFFTEAERGFGLVEIVEKFRVGMGERRNIAGIVVADFMSGSADCGDNFRMAHGTVADEEESGFGVVMLEEVEDLWRESGMRAVVEGKCNEGKRRGDTIDHVGREALERGEKPERLGPKDEEGKEGGGDAESNEERKQIHECTFVKKRFILRIRFWRLECGLAAG